MKKWTKSLLIAAGCLGILGLLLAGAGLALGGFEAAALEVDTGNRQNRTETLSPEGISSLEIDWVSGQVTLEPWDEEEIRITEITGGELKERDRMDVRREGDSLEIRFVKPGVRFNVSRREKQLEIRLPRALAENLRELEIENVSAEIKLQDLTVEELEMNTVSGDLMAEDLRAENLDFEGVSADAVIRFGDLPRSVELETVSGDAELTLPEGSEIRVNLDSVTGKLDCAIPALSGTGEAACSIEMESVSGDLKILAAN